MLYLGIEVTRENGKNILKKILDDDYNLKDAKISSNQPMDPGYLKVNCENHFE